MLSQLSDDDPCAGLDFQASSCETKLEKCFEEKFSAEMKDFFIERAIQFKQWKYLDKSSTTRAKTALLNLRKGVGISIQWSIIIFANNEAGSCPNATPREQGMLAEFEDCIIESR